MSIFLILLFDPSESSRLKTKNLKIYCDDMSTIFNIYYVFVWP